MERRLLVVAALTTLLACGGDSDNGGGGNDAGVGCSIRITVGPTNPVAPTTLSATATVSAAFGFIQIDWRVIGPGGGLIDVTRLDSAGLRVSFPAAVAGPYRVDATIPTLRCASLISTVNVAAMNARSLDLKLRYTPLPSQDAPAQTDQTVVHIAGGADLELPAPRVIDSGASAAGHVNGPSGGLPAYVRLDNASAGRYELFADTNGAFSGRVPSATYQVLVVPYGAEVPPATFTLSPAMLASGLLLDAGDVVGGVVLDGDGGAVVGARVAVSAGALPPIVVNTDGNGAFTARVRLAAGGPKLTILPAAPLYSRLASPAALALSAGAHVEVRLPAVDLVTVAPVIHDAAGQPAPGARVTFVAASLPAGGSLAVNGGAELVGIGSARATATAGAGGQLPALELPAASYEIIVEPPASSTDVPARALMDLGATTPPESLATARPVMTTITVRNAAGAGVSGARVVAVARGVLGVAAGGASTAITASGGTAALALSADLEYDLSVEAPPGGRFARARSRLAVGAGAQTITLQPALLLGGTVVFSSGSGQAGVRVEALCVDCSQPGVPIAEAITEGGGRFTMLVPDPGVEK